MKRKLCGFVILLLAASVFAPKCAADDPSASIMKEEGYTVSLDLKYSRKNRNSFQQVISLLDWGPNGFATGFVVGDGLVMTAYHVVSGELSPSKKVLLGFGVKDQLDLKISVNGCQATVLKIDVDADLALLHVCRTRKSGLKPVFQTNLSQDEKLVLFARPNNEKAVERGVFFGPYSYRGQQYWSARLVGRDGYSGSPVFNNRAELVGVFSGYDWGRKLAVISPGSRAQKLLDDYFSSAKQ